LDFYKALSTYYDIVFPFSQDKFEFLKKGLDEDAKILDVGSGTGTYSIPFAKIGYKVFSFDYSEDMAEILIDKGKGIDGFIPFKFDMDKIDEIDSDEFKLIYCIGNTLVHLGSKEKIENFFKNSFNKLDEGGSLIIQIVNYDRVLKNNISELPFINREDAGVTFKRTYEFEDGMINFIGDLKVNIKDETKEYKNSTQILPILKSELDSYAKNVGFENIEYYGSFAGAEYTDDSNALIMKCKKQ